MIMGRCLCLQEVITSNNSLINGPNLLNAGRKSNNLCVEEVGQKKIKTQDTTRYLFLDHSRIGAKKHRLSRPSTMSHQVHELNLSSSLCVSSSVWGCTSSGEQLQNINNKCPSYPCFSTKNGEKVKRRKRFLFLGGKMGREAGQALVVEKKNVFIYSTCIEGWSWPQ